MSSQNLKPVSELVKANGVRFPNESAEYRAARNALLAEEIELRRQIERVAEQRRKLPPGGEVTKAYAFIGEKGPASFADLFGNKDTLVVYNYMYGPQREQPCPMCTSLLSAWDGEVPDIQQRVAFAVIARSPIERLVAFKRARGWHHLPLYSDTSGEFSRDYHAITKEGGDPAFLGRRDGVCQRRSRTGPARRSGPDADLDHPGLHARGPRQGLVSEAELPGLAPAAPHHPNSKRRASLCA
jgi:hypothetical protein